MQHDVIPSINSEYDIFNLQWNDKGYWSLSSKILNIEEKRIYMKQSQLTEVLKECLEDVV